MSDKRPSSPPPGSWVKRARTPGEVRELGRGMEDPDPAERARRKRRDAEDKEDKARRKKTRAEKGHDRDRVRPGTSGSSIPTRSRSPSWALGRTEGVLAAGAWAGRLEIADLLEEGIDADTLLYLIRKGKESGRKLKPDGSLEDPLPRVPDEESEVAPTSRPSSPLGKGDAREVLGDMTDEEWNLALAKQKSILESLAGGGERPPWAKEKSRSAIAGRFFPADPAGVTFVKSSKPPPVGAKTEE